MKKSTFTHVLHLILSYLYYLLLACGGDYSQSKGVTVKITFTSQHFTLITSFYLENLR